MVGEDDNVLVGALAGVALLIPLVLILSDGWSWWYLVLAVVLLAAVAVLRGYLRIRREEQASRARSFEPPPRRETPEPPAQDAISEVDLPTNTADYRMLFSATAMWQMTGGSDQASHVDPGALAKQAIIERAAAVIKDALPTDAAITMTRLAAELGEWQPDGSGRVRACANEVKLEIPAEDADRIRTLSDLRKKRQLWEQEIDHQRNVREYLTDDVLTTNGRAVVWWLAQHTDDIPGAVERIGHLSRLSAVSQGRDDVMVPHLVSAQPLMRDGDDRDMTLTRELLHELFPNSSAERVLFARRLAQLAEKSGQHRYGRRLGETFGVQDVQEAPPEPEDGEPTIA